MTSRSIKFFAAAAGIALSLAAPALAQTSQDRPTPNGVSQTFNDGANRVGQGAQQIGQSIKQGAILTWHAMQNGAHAVAATFNGRQD